MSTQAGSIPSGEALLIHSLVTPTEQGIASSRRQFRELQSSHAARSDLAGAS